MSAPVYSEAQLGIDWDRAAERAGEWSEAAAWLINRWFLLDDCFGDRRQFSILDVERIIGPPPGSGNAAGALFGRLSRQGRIVACGRVRSPRPEAHRRTVTLWRAA